MKRGEIWWADLGPYRLREQTGRRPVIIWVAVGTAVTRCPPHRPVRALLTHTVLTSDRGMIGVEAHVGIRLQNLERGQ